jgi:uncharacterized protein
MPTIEQARTWYSTADVVHDFEHVERVYHMAERLALIEGADLEIVRAAALLHDAEGASPGGADRAEHHFSSAEFAEKILTEEGWPSQRIAAVQHCIRAHRYRDEREPPATPEARVLFDADKLDVLGAIGAARTIAYAVLAGEPIYSTPSERFMRNGDKEVGEPHSAYHEYIFKLQKIKTRLFTQSARRLAEARDAYLKEFFVQMAAEIKGER